MTQVRFVGLICFVLALLCIGIFGDCACASPKGWHGLDGCLLSSVAWSPDGKHIAFVSISKKDMKYGGEGESGETLLPSAASIWVLKADSAGTRPVMWRLARRTRRQGIPTSLFWISSKRVAWSDSGNKDFTFFLADIRDGRISRFVQRRFAFRQVLAESESAPYAPDDVYWDHAHRSIVFSGGRVGQRDAVGIYDLRHGKLRTIVVSADDPISHQLYLTFFGVPGSSTDPLCFAALRGSEQGNGIHDQSMYGLWISRTPQPSFRNSKLITRGDWIFYPRLSPGRTRLAWIGGAQPAGSRSLVTHVVIQNLKNGKRQSFGLPYTYVSQPRLGCPFGWSPDGKCIAYADGHRIRVKRL